MAEYIKRETLVHRLKNPYLFNITPRIFEIISEIPAADVAPVVHARWVQIDDDVFACSHCRADWVFSEATPKEMKLDYCPQCGAKMDGTADG